MSIFKKSTQYLQYAFILFGVTLLSLPVAHAQKAASTNADLKQSSTVSARAEPKLADAILVVVNNEVITRREFLERLQEVESRLQKQGGQMPPREQLQHQLLERMIVERAELQQAKEQGIRADDATLDRAIGRIAEQNQLSIPAFRKELENRGMSFSKFRENIRNEIIIQRLREREVDNKIQVTDAEIDNYLAAHHSEAGAAAQELDIAQILIGVPENATAAQLAERRKRAEEVVSQLNSGGDFAKLSAAYSDASNAMSGGDMGWRGADRLPQLFVDATAKLQQGQIAPIIKSANGFHILKLLGRRTQSVMHSEADATAPAAVMQTRASHILIKVNQVVSAAEARRKLMELKQRLDNHSATFEELAKLYSNDFSAAQGGDLGWIYPGDTVPEFERAMNALPIGQVSDPVETRFGYHLILVKERKTTDVSKERQRLVARQAIRAQKIEEATQDWLRQVRDRAYVEYRE